MNDIIYGALLGDAYISRLDNGYAVYYRLEVEHSVKDTEYITWLQEALKDVLPHSRDRTRNAKLDGRSIESSTVHMYGKVNKDFEAMYNEIYRSGVKTVTQGWLDKLTPRSIAVWYMDDGSYHINRNTIEIYTYSFTLAEHHLMQRYFRDTWKIEPNVLRHGERYYLYFPRQQASELLRLISPYIVSGMERKLPKGWELADELPHSFHTRLNRKIGIESCRETVIENIRSFCAEHDVSTGFPVVEYNYTPGAYSFKAIQYVFGGWQQALEAAGAPTSFI